jgi:hypothetical protein
LKGGGKGLNLESLFTLRAGHQNKIWKGGVTNEKGE